MKAFYILKTDVSTMLYGREWALIFVSERHYYSWGGECGKP
jgi:hypothetical protein